MLVATIGPSIQREETLKAIINEGVEGIRFNFSHGNLEEFHKQINLIRNINSKIHIIQDITGSKIRVSFSLKSVMKIYRRERVLFCGEEIYDNNLTRTKDIKVIPLNISADFLNDTAIKEISMKDNTMNFKILSISKYGILATVIRGGMVRQGKGCNIIGIKRDNSKISDKDKKDIIWGIKNGVDIICQSFVEDDVDVLLLKDYVKSISRGVCKQKIWAKIETKLGVKNVEKIGAVVDGIVIGRGDLIPETSIIETPMYEEEIMKKLSNRAIDKIIATHLLNSMKNGNDVEISEVESIYNHIKQGVTGFMLAGETSIGKYPIETVKFLRRVIDKYEGAKNE